VASHFSSKAEWLEDAMYKAGVAKKYKEACKHVSEIWDERQKKQADDRGRWLQREVPYE